MRSSIVYLHENLNICLTDLLRVKILRSSFTHEALSKLHYLSRMIIPTMTHVIALRENNTQVTACNKKKYTSSRRLILHLTMAWPLVRDAKEITSLSRQRSRHNLKIGHRSLFTTMMCFYNHTNMIDGRLYPWV